LRVLVVEDDTDARITLEELIGLFGHQAIGAANATEALHDARHNDLDVALIDIGLPTVDGCEVARRIRARGRSVPWLVALTGFSDRRTREAAKSAGFDDFIVKPVMPDHLERLLSGVKSNVRRR
jgi:CheY-like chemotaxis protein